MARALTPTERLIIVTEARKLYPAMSLAAIAENLTDRGIRVSHAKVRQLLVEDGVEIAAHGGARTPGARDPGKERRKSEPLRPTERDLIVSVGQDMYPARSLRDVAAELARRGLTVSAATVRDVLVDAGIEMMPRGKKRPIEPRLAPEPVEHQPRIAARMAMCINCRTHLGIAEAELRAAARYAAAQKGSLSPQLSARIDAARDEIRHARERQQSCSECATRADGNA